MPNMPLHYSVCANTRTNEPARAVTLCVHDVRTCLYCICIHLTAEDTAGSSKRSGGKKAGIVVGVILCCAVVLAGISVFSRQHASIGGDAGDETQNSIFNPETGVLTLSPCGANA
jgi:hypothetical protein